MQIPSEFYGRSADVKSNAKKIAKVMARTRNFDSFAPTSFIEVEAVDGLIFVDREHYPTGENHFHCYALAVALAAAVPLAERSQFLTDWLLSCLADEWRFVFTIGRDATLSLLYRDESVQRKYVDAGIRFWPALNALGKRFAPIDDYPVGIWNKWSSMWYALQQLGVPASIRELPPGGPAELFATHGRQA
jgi:hypothetical protein